MPLPVVNVLREYMSSYESESIMSFVQTKHAHSCLKPAKLVLLLGVKFTSYAVPITFCISGVNILKLIFNVQIIRNGISVKFSGQNGEILPTMFQLFVHIFKFIKMKDFPLKYPGSNVKTIATMVNILWKIFHWNIQDRVGKDCDNGLCSLWHPCLHSLLYEYGQGCLISYIQSKSSWSSLDDYHMQQLHQHHCHHICHHQLQQQYHHHRRHHHHHGQ